MCSVGFCVCVGGFLLFVCLVICCASEAWVRVVSALGYLEWGWSWGYLGRFLLCELSCLGWCVVSVWFFCSYFFECVDDGMVCLLYACAGIGA